MQFSSSMYSNVTTSTRINSSSVHTYIFVCFIRNSLRVILQGFVDPIMQQFQQLDSASGETATSSNLGRPTRIQFLQIPYQLQDFQRSLKNPQCSSSQVAKLPVQWMPFPQYPLRSRMKILLQELQELLDNHEHPEEAPKEFHPQGLDYKSDISCTDILISEREML